MKTLDELPAILDSMISSQKEKKSKTYVAKYKGKNLIMRSGKSSWKAVGHAKSAVLNHFGCAEHSYRWANDSDDWKERDERTKQFRAKLWELVEIVELKD